MISDVYKSVTGKSSFLAVAALVLVGGFFAYRNFSSQLVLPDDLKIQSTNFDGLSLKDAETESEEGVIAGGATGPQVSQKTFGLGIVAGVQDQKMNSKPANPTTWVARILVKESLKNNSSYTVQKGDTLWEIAKAKYGNGSDWHKILESNKDKVGFLPNGSQARIEIGQELRLP